MWPEIASAGSGVACLRSIPVWNNEARKKKESQGREEYWRESPGLWRSPARRRVASPQNPIPLRPTESPARTAWASGGPVIHVPVSRLPEIADCISEALRIGIEL